MTTTLQEWAGTCLGTGHLAVTLFGTGSTSVSPPPDPVLAVSNGGSTFLVSPPQLGHFLRTHAGAQFICHDAGELHHALHDCLGTASDPEAQQLLWQVVADGRLHDVGLLDQLVGLARDGAGRPCRRSLQQLVRRDVGAASPGEEVQAVGRVFNALWKQADAVVPGSVAAGAASRFGVLSLALQVKGDVALAHARHHGLRVAPPALTNIMGACLQARKNSEALLLQDEEVCPCFKTRDGQIRCRPDGSPEVRRKRLRSWLQKMSDSPLGLHQHEIALPPADGSASDDPADWEELVGNDRLLQAWYDLVVLPELGRSCADQQASGLRPCYELLPRLRSRGPDLDVLRRLGVQGVFEPAAGHVFLALRLRDLKLRSLAAVCRHRYGRSTLADVFDQGGDPCEHAAAALPTPEDHERRLRAARALLSAAPLGLGKDRVCEIVREQPGLAEVTHAEAAGWYKRLVEQVFPELSAYLADDTLAVMAGNMGTTTNDLDTHLDGYFRPVPPPPQLRKWFRDYSNLTGRTQQCLQALLEHCAYGSPLLADLQAGLSDRGLCRALFGRTVVTLTGRVRARLPFGQTRAAGYLDLADDAVKAALFAVVRGGYRVAAYAEDTTLVELHESLDTAGRAEEARKLAREGAEEVLRGIPAVCEVEVLARW
jgi:hypothetical protein